MKLKSIYFDANSLYSWAMCNDLPVGEFRWVKKDRINNFMNKVILEKNYYFFVECDITYSKELHDLHNDYTLAPKKVVIDKKFKKSTYQNNIIKKFEKDYNTKVGKSKVPKLVSTFSNKSSYVVH